MLTETFITSTSHAPTNPTIAVPNASVVKDASIHLHTFQPAPRLRASLKASQTRCANTLVINDTHIFAAQSEKATVHIYSRQRHNQEAITSFGDRISSIALALDGDVLVAGTEKGRLIFWEVKTGRAIHTSAAHIQPVSCLAVDEGGQNVVSGSADAVAHVWNLLEHLNISIPGSDGDTAAKGPMHSFTAHRGPITAVSMGHSKTTCNFALTASKDRTVRVWDYFNGMLLRTFVLDATPLCLALDPADRTAFAGCEDGRVVLVDFYAATRSQVRVPDAEEANIPVQVKSNHHWSLPGSASDDISGNASGSMKKSTDDKTAPKAAEVANPNGILCASLNHDATVLLTGHNSSCANAWDTATGRFLGKRAFYPTSGAVTNLQFLPVAGVEDEKLSPLPCHTVTKPKWSASFSSGGGGNWREAVEGYAVNAQVNSRAEDCPTAIHPSKNGLKGETFSESLHETQETSHAEMIDGGLTLLRESEQQTSAGTALPKDAMDREMQEDYLPISSAKSRKKNVNKGEDSLDPTSLLKAQLTQLQSAQESSEKVIRALIDQKRQLRQERKLWLKRESERLERERLKRKRTTEKEDEEGSERSGDESESDLSDAEPDDSEDADEGEAMLTGFDNDLPMDDDEAEQSDSTSG